LPSAILNMLRKTITHLFSTNTIGSRRNITLSIVLLAALAIPYANLRAQTAASPAESDSVVQSHFVAAQQAQRIKDFATAEHEYRAVIALAPGFAEVHMNLGLVYQLQDRLSEAMTEFRRALKLKSSLTGANFFLGVDYCKLGEGAAAIPYLQAALQAAPNLPDIWLWLATAQQLTGDFSGEVGTLRQALALQPKNVDLLYLLGSSYERLGKQQVAQMNRLAPGSSRNEQLLAESYAASNEWPSAVIHFQNAIAAAPNQPGLHGALGEELLRAGKVAQAIPEFDEELRIDPDSLRALVRRGEAEFIQQKLDSALQDWTQAIALDKLRAERILGLREMGFGDSAGEQLPDATREGLAHLETQLQIRDTPAAHLALAFLYSQRGNAAQIAAQIDQIATPEKNLTGASSCSETDIKAALQREEFSQIAPCVSDAIASRAKSDLLIPMASALLDAGEYEAAFMTLEGLPVAQRNSPEAAYWRALCYEKLATAAYLQLYQADPDSYRLHQLLGDLNAAKGDDRKAIEEYRAAVTAKPTVSNLHYSLGHLLWKNLKVPEARVEFEAELALNPNHAGALDDLGDTYLLEHQPAKALPYLTRALVADSANSDIHRDLGTAYSELKDYPKAEAEFKIAVASDHDGAVHYKLARVYQALGDKESAAREFAFSTSLNRETHSKLEKQTERLAAITNTKQDE
jgi:tetratricopeptide (TPR) repeat protein